MSNFHYQNENLIKYLFFLSLIKKKLKFFCFIKFKKYILFLKKFYIYFQLNRIFKLSFIFMILIFSFTSCKNNKAKKVDELEREIGSTITIRNFERIAISKDGKLMWKLNAKETYYFNSTDISILYEMNIEQFENNKVKSKIKADKGIINKRENKIKAIGNIYVKTIEGKILEAEELEMDTESNLVTSDKYVKIKSDGTIIKGIGLRAENGLNKFKILKPEAISSPGSNPLQK